MKISIIGTGRIGLPLGLSLAKAGHQVLFTDRDKKKLKSLSLGVMPFYEPQLKETFLEAKTNCQWKSSIQDICSSEVVFLTLSTPVLPNGNFDISGALSWVKTLCQFAKEKKILVLKSTLPPGKQCPHSNND